MRPSVDNVNHNEDVLELVHAIMHAVRSRQHLALRDTAGITPMEARVLRFFQRHPGATLSALAEHSGRDKAQLARLVKALRERGLLAAAEDGEDRRQVPLALSPEGEAMHKKLRQLHRRLAERCVEGMSEHEHRQLKALLLRVQSNLRD